MLFCKACFREMPDFGWRALFGGNPPLCERCFAALDPRMEHFAIGGCKAMSLYRYNDEVRDLLFRFKACGDAELAPVFLSYQAPYLRLRYHGYVLVPAPSYAGKDDERGFNHVIEMFAVLGLPFAKAIAKTDDVKQATAAYAERQRIGEHLRWDETVDLKGRKALFVDDLCTSGATAKACCSLIKAHGAARTEILVMGRTMLKNDGGKA